MCSETQEWLVVSSWLNSCLLLPSKGRSHLLFNREKRSEELAKKKEKLEKRQAEEYAKKLEEEVSTHEGWN